MVKRTKEIKMNPDNYCTLELSRKLAENGIQVETEAKWIIWPMGLAELVYNWQYRVADVEVFPAPSFAELWRELPESRQVEYLLTIKKMVGETIVGYENRGSWLYYIRDAKTADALAELLVWVRKEQK
jgi:hypothetical protein